MKSEFAPMLSRSLAVFSCAVLTIPLISCTPDIPPAYCKSPDANCLINHSLESVQILKKEIVEWSRIQFLAQVIVAISGLVATIMIALQGDENRYWTRPVGLIATSLVTAVTSALVSFHVPDNVDKLITVVDRMVIATNEFAANTGKLSAGRSKEEVEELYKTDATFRQEYANIMNKYVKEFNRLKVETMRINGTAGQLNNQIGISSTTNSPDIKINPPQ